MRHLISVSALLWMCVACVSKKEERPTASTITYELKTFRVESASGCAIDSIPCAYYEIQYPYFTGLTPAVRDSLYQSISVIVDTGNPENDSISFHHAGKLFIEGFDEFVSEFDDTTLGWSFQADVKVSILSDTLISLYAHAQYYTGGAHGGYGKYFCNIDPKTGRQITLADVLKPGYEKALVTAGEKAFRAEQNLADTDSFADAGFEFRDNRFHLNDTYGFTPQGILFVFNVYEIAPYVMGAQEIFIPYTALQDWLK